MNRPEFYFSITPKADTVHFMSEDHTLDIEGFELKKALGLMMKTNPIESDWLHSDLVYIEAPGFKEKMLEFERIGRSHNTDPVDERLVAYMNNLRYYYEKFLPNFKAAKPLGNEDALIKNLMETVSSI